MNRLMLGVLVGMGAVVGAGASMLAAKSIADVNAGDAPMRLGNFSVSLTVKDLAVSMAFYEKLGFRQVSGEPAKNWVVLQNETTKIGLFQGMFPKNTLTFNPGWDGSAKSLSDFEDIRDLQKTLKSRGLKPAPEADESSTGPAYFMLLDPDGNPVLFDQHVDRPKK